MIRYISLEDAKRDFPHLTDDIARGDFIIHVPHEQYGGKDAAYICVTGNNCYYFVFKEDPAARLHEDLYIIAECLVWKVMI